jgi:hypothetical protein
MGWFRKQLKKVVPAATASPSDAEIIAALDSWALACATGANNGTMGAPGSTFSRPHFDLWWMCAEENIVLDCQKKISVTSSQIKQALKNYAVHNASKTLKQVMAEQEKLRGLPPSLVLGPGESASFSVNISLPTNEN